MTFLFSEDGHGSLSRPTQFSHRLQLGTHSSGMVLLSIGYYNFTVVIFVMKLDVVYKNSFSSIYAIIFRKFQQFGFLHVKFTTFSSSKWFRHHYLLTC